MEADNQADEPKEAHIFRHERIFTILGGIRKATEAVYEGEIIGGFMAESFKLYESVRIKATGITGVIVAKNTDGGEKPPIYFVEKDEQYKTGNPNYNCVWCEPGEIERRGTI